MLIGLGDDDGIPDMLRRPDEDESYQQQIPELLRRPDDDPSTITIYQKPAAKKVPRTGPTKVLDVVMPKKLGADGAIKVWGMPPAVAYTLVAMVLAGAGYFAYQTLGHRRTSNPRRARRGHRAKKSRRKR